MKEYLQKLKLIDHFTIDLEISRHEFVRKLTALVEEGSIGVFSGFGEAFSRSKKEFRGTVTADGFT